MRELTTAKTLSKLSTVANTYPLVEHVWRKWQGLDDSNAALLNWRMAQNLMPDDNWPAALPAEKGASAINMKTWRRDVIAVKFKDMVERAQRINATADSLRFASAYMLGSVGMVGVAELVPPMQATKLGDATTQYDFLRLQKHTIQGDVAFGVIVATGPGPNHTALGSVTVADPTAFDALPTYYIGPATEADSASLLHI